MTVTDVVIRIERFITARGRAPEMILLNPSDWRVVHQKALAVAAVRISSAREEGSGLKILDVSIVPDGTIELGFMGVVE